MQIWRRVFYRAGVLTQAWADHHAFELGLFFGGSVALALLLGH